MFIEFLDQLRCTQPHEESWLVAAFAEQRDRFIVRGTLGCPICFREYAIVDGIAYFGVDPASVSLAPPALINTDRAMQAAAMLNARERCTLVLAGQWAPLAHAITELLPMRIFALDPSSVMDDSEMVAILRADQTIPLTPGSIDGVALDRATVSDATLEAALRVLRPGGRLVAPAQTPLPAGVNELVRDTDWWVAETDAALVTLRRR